MIYDFKLADTAMSKLHVDPIQFHLLFLLYHRSDGLSTNAQLERFKAEVLGNEDEDMMRKRIDKLEELGLIENLANTTVDESGLSIRKYEVDYMIPTEKFINVVIMETAGDELWDKYPAAFPLSSGGHFLARIGDKDEIIELYNRKIKRDVKKHFFVMKMLQVFITLNKSNKINGVKIQNFIQSEMWDTVAEISNDNITITDHGNNI